jgi:hypothetical protein
MEAEAAAAGPAPRARGPIRVTLPAAIAYDPDRLKKSLGDILGQIGCRACCSGADIFLQMERDFLVDPESNVATVKGEPDFGGALAKSHQFTVGLSSKVKFDIDRVFEAVDRVIDILGPHPCISGFDVLLQDELRTIVVDSDLKARRFDQRF